MKSNIRILVVAEDDNMGKLYQAAFKDGKYDPQVCNNLTNLFEFVSYPPPHLIFWYYETSRFKNILNSLRKIRKMYDGDEQPIILLAMPTDLGGEGFEGLIDGTVENIFDLDWFLALIEKLLQERLA
jgi:DNA-binding NtrC family response regulator